MKISDLNSSFLSYNRLQETEKKDNVFKELIEDTIEKQKESQQLTEDFINGKDVELHEVMIASEKAKTSLELLMEIRNKSIDMYRELMRMQ
jgi:flagellar hook-basal body complex protein FliE